MNTSTKIMTRDTSATTAAVARPWALWAAVAVATVTAVLHTFVQAAPTLDALMAGDAAADARQGLRMMWHGMSAIAWSYPVVLVLLRHRPAAVTRPALGCVALLNGSQAVMYVATGLVGHGMSGLLSLPEWVLHAAVAVLAWQARPARPPGRPAPRARRGAGRLVLLWIAIAFSTFMAAFHTVYGTFDSWPAALLDSDTALDPKLTLYAMWLFSCVLFWTVPLTVVWALRARTGAGRLLLVYVAALVTALAVSWTVTKALGIAPDLPPTGPVSLGLLAALTVLSARPRSRRRTDGRNAEGPSGAA
ncbi:hypothetical protein [Streptomyces telluris]|uniref:Uncharacterized protein n=1 Tax=Streptomyces telluris TaxID=2720021 RepID=A0A9X2RJB6_9ACTN|nr:hypothetical protein [Streptomyces telluris]MCQ8768523.1 hypothetical protein [Streptomyces telluris]NJP80408.1 hypothetical protein [Streptomyces telluris]